MFNRIMSIFNLLQKILINFLPLISRTSNRSFTWAFHLIAKSVVNLYSVYSQTIIQFIHILIEQTKTFSVKGICNQFIILQNMADPNSF